MYFKGNIPETNENLYFTGGNLFVSQGVLSNLRPPINSEILKTVKNG